MSNVDEMLTQIIKLSPRYADVLSHIDDEWRLEEDLRQRVMAGTEDPHTRQFGKEFFFGVLLDLERRNLIEHGETIHDQRYRQWRAKPLT